MRQFTPYGEPIPLMGSTASLYGFTGEQTDPNGLVHLRARNYLPELGVFPSLDMVMGTNRYGYVAGDPVNRVDPSGMAYTAPLPEYKKPTPPPCKTKPCQPPPPPPPSGNGGVQVPPQTPSCTKTSGSTLSKSLLTRGCDYWCSWIAHGNIFEPISEWLDCLHWCSANKLLPLNKIVGPQKATVSIEPYTGGVQTSCNCYAIKKGIMYYPVSEWLYCLSWCNKNDLLPLNPIIDKRQLQASGVLTSGACGMYLNCYDRCMCLHQRQYNSWSEADIACRLACDVPDPYENRDLERKQIVAACNAVGIAATIAGTISLGMIGWAKLTLTVAAAGTGEVGTASTIAGAGVLACNAIFYY